MQHDAPQPYSTVFVALAVRFFNIKQRTQITVPCMWSWSSPTDGGPPCRGGGTYGLRESCRFRFLGIQRGKLLRVPLFGPQNPAYGVLKSLGIPFRECVRRAFWRYHRTTILASILRSWHRGSCNSKRLCIYGVRAVYGCLAV